MLTSFLLVIVVFGTSTWDTLDCYSYKTSVRLMNDVLSVYDPRQRPISDQTKALNVSVTFYVLTIKDFDEVSEKFSVYGLLFLTWVDEIITWNPADYDYSFSAMFKLNEVWYPKLVLTNPSTKLSDLGDDWMTIRILYSGYTYFVPGAVFESSCSVDVTYYPFDTQDCSLDMNVWGYLGAEVALYALHDKVQTEYYVKNGEWTLESTSVERIMGGLDTSDTIKFNFRIKRKPMFLVINVILPIAFMAVINLLVFVLPAESGERVSYSVTVLLALAVFMTLVGDNLPKTSEPMPIFSYYLMIILTLSTLMTVVTILNLHVYFKKGEVVAWCGSITRTILYYQCRWGKISQSNDIPIGSGNENRQRVGAALTEVDEMHDVKNRTRVGISVNISDVVRKITWQDVSTVIDRMCLLIFFSASVIVNTVFLIILAENKDL